MTFYLPVRLIYSVLSIFIFLIPYSSAVAQAPVIVSLTSNPVGFTNPLSVGVCDGSDATLSIIVTNNPTGFTWQSSVNGYNNFVTLTDDATYSGSSTATLIIHTSLLTQNLYYRVSASNSSGTSNILMILLINKVPQMAPIHALQSTTYCAGQNEYATFGAHSLDYALLENKLDSLNWTFSGTGAIGLPKTGLGGFREYGAVLALMDSMANVSFQADATSGLLSVTGSNLCGTSVPSSIPITFNPLQNSLAGTAGGPSICFTSLNDLSVAPGMGTFSDPSCNIIASVIPSGTAPPLNGQIVSCVTIDASVQTYNGSPYVQRHYNIDLIRNAFSAVATATITLYYTQMDFDNFNASRGALPALPTGPTDLAGISNIRITQFHGAGTAPGTYLGTAGTIQPAAGNIVWNASASRWEITFDIVGFSGFFLSTASLNPLPLTLLNFRGTQSAVSNDLNWTTADEVNVSNFEIQRSTDATHFETIAQVPAKNGYNRSNYYRYSDFGLSGTDQSYYYRLKMIDFTGDFTFSSIVFIQPNALSFRIQPLPNPFRESLSVRINSPKAASINYSLIDNYGRLLFMQTKNIQKGTNVFPVKETALLPGGFYFLIIQTPEDKQILKIQKSN